MAELHPQTPTGDSGLGVPPSGGTGTRRTSAGQDVRRRTVLSGSLFGCGIAASMIDLFVFHLGLQWHHFYDRSTPEVALLADAFFHAFGWFVTVLGLVLLADVRRRGGVHWQRWTGAVVAGVGFFQLLDGVFFHKVLRVHQIRYDVDLLPYDLTWIGSAVVALVLGVLVVWRTGRSDRTA